MIRITAVAGNVSDGSTQDGMAGDSLERVILDRADLQRSRLRRKSDRGTDVGLDMPPGTVLHHGDLVVGDGRTLVIEQKPETVCVVRPRPGKTAAGLMVLVGHAIGNMHRPVAIREEGVVFPVQDPSELETFRSMLDRVGPDLFELSLASMIFVPHRLADVRGHA